MHAAGAAQQAHWGAQVEMHNMYMQPAVHQQPAMQGHTRSMPVAQPVAQWAPAPGAGTTSFIGYGPASAGMPGAAAAPTMVFVPAQTGRGVTSYTHSR